jgi:O-antigen/teichoic acid export membrane protein
MTWKTGTDVASKLFSKLAVMALEFVALYAIGRMLGPSQYAAWTQTVLTAALLVPLISFSLDSAIVRLLPLEEDGKRTGIYVTLVGFSLASALLVGGALMLVQRPLGAVIFGTSEEAALIPYTAGLLLARGMFIVAASYLQAFGRIKSHAAAEILRALGTCSVLVICLFILRQSLPQALAIVVVWETSIAVAVFLFIALRGTGYRLPERSTLGKYFRFGAPLIPAELTYWFITYANRLFLAGYWTLDDVGRYAAAYRFATVLSLFYSSFCFALPPLLFRAWENAGRPSAGRIMRMFSHAYFVAALPVCVFLIHLSEVATRTLASSEFLVSPLITAALVAALLALGWNSLWVYAIYLQKKTRTVLAIYGGVAVASCALNFLTIPRWGVLGAAWNAILSYGALAVITYVVGRRVLGSMIELRYIWRVVAAAGCSYALLFWSHPATVIGAAIWCLGYCALYGVLLWALLRFPHSLRASDWLLIRRGEGA